MYRVLQVYFAPRIKHNEVGDRKDGYSIYTQSFHQNDYTFNASEKTLKIIKFKFYFNILNKTKFN